MKNIPLYEVRKISDLKDMLAQSVDKYSSKAAFLVKEPGNDAYKPVSYKQFDKDVKSLGTALKALGLENRRVAVIGENRYEWAVTYLSVVNGLGTIVPLDRELPANEIENLLKRAEVQAIVYSSKLEAAIDRFKDHLETVKYYINMDLKTSNENTLSFKELMKNGEKALENGDQSYVNAEVDPEAVDILLFTSGTTEEAKAVMLTHTNIVQNLMAMCSMLYIDEKDTFLSVLPLHHTYECTCGFLCQIYRGSTIAYCEGLRHIAKNLKESKTTVMLGVPLIFESMYRLIWNQAAKNGLDNKLKKGIKISNFLKVFGIDATKRLFKAVHDNFGGHLRLFISGAAGIDPNIARGFRDIGIKLVQGYGLTECAPIVGLNRDCDYKDDAAGLPLPGLDVKIDEKGDDGIGEILVKGRSVMKGYYQNTDATDKVFTTDGYFRTGDLGFIDSDGFIHITGRKKNVIITKNGKNVYPEELEQLLNAHPLIKESLVYGKENTDSDTYITAKIVIDEDEAKARFEKEELPMDIIKSEIKAYIKDINSKMVSYKIIRDFEIRTNEFEKTTTKKIKRYKELHD